MEAKNQKFIKQIVILQIEIASEAVFYVYQTLQDCDDALLAIKEESGVNGKTIRISPAAQECISKLRNEFETKLADDLHTPSILNASLQEALRFMNSSLNMLKKKQQKQQQLSIVKSLVDLQKVVKEVLNVLGLLSSSSYAEVLQQLKDKALKRANLTEDDVLHLIEDRMLARKNKEFSRSDQIRSDLVAKGIALMDVGKETVWRPCVPVQQEEKVVPVTNNNKPDLRAQQENGPVPAEKGPSVLPTDK